jgi:hypothetical protein
LTSAPGTLGEQLNEIIIEANGHRHTGHNWNVAEVATFANGKEEKD